MVKSFKIIESFRYFGKYGMLEDLERHISDVIKTADCACNIIRKNGYESIKYEYLLREVSKNSKFVQSAIINKIEPNYEVITITEKLFAEYLLFEESKGHYLTYEAIEFDAIDSDLCKDVKMWIAVKDTQYYDTYYKLQDYINTLTSKHFEYELYRSLYAEIDNYKPTKEQRLEAYFVCNNLEVLKTILMQDASGTRGVQLSIILRALEQAGCTRKGGVKPLLENVLKPIYGAAGTHQALSDALKKVNDIQTTEAIKRKAEEYKKLLQ